MDFCKYFGDMKLLYSLTYSFNRILQFVNFIVGPREFTIHRFIHSFMLTRSTDIKRMFMGKYQELKAMKVYFINEQECKNSDQLSVFVFQCSNLINKSINYNNCQASS
jgi:hypothetical protein